MNNLIIGRREALNNWFRKFNTIIDPQNNAYKTQENIFGVFKTGNFKSLPKLNYVLIFKSMFAKCESCSIADYENNSYYQISLVHGKNNRIIVHESRIRNEAFHLAKTMASALKIPLKDSATNREKGIWIQ